MRNQTTTMLMASAMLIATGAAAQQNSTEPRPVSPQSDSTPLVRPAPPKVSLLRTMDIQNIRPADKRGLNVFESPKDAKAEFKGFTLSIGGAFEQQFQNLTHDNSATPKLVSGVDANQLIAISPGFNNSVANLFLNVQLAPGIRVAMTSYLSARHHNESWVKDGYLLIDGSPIDHPLLRTIMDYVTLRVGQFEVNYGDEHFRRTDNGNGMYNPFVGNLIIDAFTTEVGAEAYVRSHGAMAMVGVTSGESRGMVTSPTKRTAAYLAKIGFDRKLSDDLRVRLTGSMYTISKAGNNVLFSGDRAGSQYYSVLEHSASTESAQAWSGEIQPGFGHNVKAFVVNPFIKWNALEFFGNIETASGRSWAETTDRTWRQNSYEALYRLGSSDKFYVGGRYTNATGQFANVGNDLSVDRTQIGGGWYITPNVLFKLESVNQQYHNFPATDIRSGGSFKGLMMAGVVGF